LIRIPDQELEWSYVRSGGPGGQNVNKVATKAQLRWRASATVAAIPEPARARMQRHYPARFTTDGDVVIQSQKYREQERNRADCLDKLAAMIREALIEPTPRKKTRPGRGAQRRRLAAKKRQSLKKQRRRSAAEE
jgi:ribosome-associated protein